MKYHFPYHHLSIILPILLLSCNMLSTKLAQGSPTTAASTSGDLLIGSLRSCAHNVSGDVYVLNSNQIKIKNFTYDGLGNKAWFHIMTPKALTIHAALPDTFVPVYNDNGDCAAINRSYSNEDLTIILPTGHPKTKNLTINQIKSFGVFSYGDCSNYGNVYFVHKWRALFASNKSLIPGVALKTEPCWPPVIPDLSNPQFCNPGAVKFREFFGECVEHYGAVPKSGGSLMTIPVEIFGRRFFILLMGYLGISMAFDLHMYSY